jgi:site-specific DNA-methyltransferase (adenine-specific)
MGTWIETFEQTTTLDYADNEPGAIEKLQELNEFYRCNRWPKEYSSTKHSLVCGDARNFPRIDDESIHLIVTSPPYWTLKDYPDREGQLGGLEDYETFLSELDRVWSECVRVLVPGGRVCCVVGDVCLPRKKAGRHHVVPLHADITVRMRKLGVDSLTPILWFKIANGALEAEGNGAGFYGKPYQPGAIVKNDFEYILFFRKGGAYRSPSTTQKALSMLSKNEMKDWLRTAWTDIKGESTRKGHPAPFPVELAERLIRLFSFAGDTVLDPFVGTGTTAVAAMETGRNSIGIDIDPIFIDLAWERLQKALLCRREPHLFEAKLNVQSP